MAKHITMEERDQIADLVRRRLKPSEIALRMNRHHSVICRELKRNQSDDGQYHAAAAHQRAIRRRKERPLVRKMDRPEISGAVESGLHDDWSPDQISGRLRQQFPEDRKRWISAKTIYSWIRSDSHRSLWESHLRRRGKAPSRRKKAPLPENQRIRNRPDVIEARMRAGDFECDTVLGPPGTGGMATMVDRRTRKLIMTTIRTKHAGYVATRMMRRLRKATQLPVRSLTFDNGTEFADHQRLAKGLHAAVFFAQPGCPYQRGTNENTNGLIRQYFPKGQPLNTVSEQRCRQVEFLINNRPRECLGYRTPIELEALIANDDLRISDS
jgi:transposase, IS30 family